MKKALLTGIAALLLATGSAHANEWQDVRRKDRAEWKARR